MFEADGEGRRPLVGSRRKDDDLVELSIVCVGTQHPASSAPCLEASEAAEEEATWWHALVDAGAAAVVGGASLAFGPAVSSVLPLLWPLLWHHVKKGALLYLLWNAPPGTPCSRSSFFCWDRR